MTSDRLFQMYGPATTDWLTNILFGKFWMAIFPKRVIGSTACLVPGYGFWGQRIVWIYLQLNQIQESAARHLWQFWMNVSLEWVGLSDPLSCDRDQQLCRNMGDNNARGVIRLVTIGDIPALHWCRVQFCIYLCIRDIAHYMLYTFMTYLLTNNLPLPLWWQCVCCVIFS